MTILLVLLALTAVLFLLRRRVSVSGFAWRTWFSIACGAVTGYMLMTFISHFGEPTALAILPMSVWKIGMAVVGIFMLSPVIRAALETVLPSTPQSRRDEDPRRRQ